MSSDINQDQMSLNQCNDKSPYNPDIKLDPPPPFCGDNKEEPNLRAPNDETLNWLKDQTRQKQHLGSHALCDPMQTGDVTNSLENPDRNTIYRYSRSIDGTDEAMRDLFSNITVRDENGKDHPVPIIWGTQEKAVAYLFQENTRKDDTLVVDRIKLPILAISRTGLDYDLARYTYHQAKDYMRYLRPDNKPGFTIDEQGLERSTVFGITRGIPINLKYTLYAWTMYIQDMNQILEQILLKFSQTAYIRVTGVPWEIIVKLESTGDNTNFEPGDQDIRVIKFEFNMTVETYIPQPITRNKAVLKIKIDFVDGMTENEINQVLTTLETSVKELEC
jgi:hypothetical protein